MVDALAILPLQMREQGGQNRDLLLTTSAMEGVLTLVFRSFDPAPPRSLNPCAPQETRAETKITDILFQNVFLQKRNNNVGGRFVVADFDVRNFAST
jgi:hypothetical protein